MLYITTAPFLFKRHEARVSLTSTAQFKRLVIVLLETFEPQLESAAASECNDLQILFPSYIQLNTSRTYLMNMQVHW